MTFRIIPIQTNSAAMNMAYDEACMEAIRNDEAPNTIRLYRWKPSAVSIGYFQCLTDEIDVDACRQDDIAIVRRQTGGGAVFHDYDGEITYSIIGKVEDFPTDVIASYKEICNVIISALREIGIQAEFRPINDIIADNKKLSGNAQTRKGGVFLQHGTILLSVDPQKMFSYLTPDKSKIADKPFIKSVMSAVTSINDLVKLDREVIEAKIRKAFIEKYPATPGTWSEEEQDRAKQLAQEKYSDESWNAMR